MTDRTLSRRTVLGGAVLGAAAIAAPAGAQTQSEAGTAAADGSPRLSDPRTRYTSEPFPEQKQPWPGLQSQMTPVPDCGETSYRGSGRLTGRRALVTGGDSGIGRAAAIAFAREGADVAINYHPDEQPDAEDVAKLIREAGRKAVLLPADIRTLDACEGIVRQAVEALGGLDLLVNNAAYQQSKADISEISDEQFVRTYETNVFHTFRVSKAAIPSLPPGGVIINTISVNSYDPGEELIDYASTKAAILNLTKGMAKQLAKKGIRVNAVAPGPVWTPLQVAGGQIEGTMGEFGQDTPLGRAGQPAELAPLYVALAEDGTSFSTGTAVGAHGGKGNP
ncbi:SDR family oxidoreductase [Aureimonas sp. Leaf324]|jgi:NAD(P)-dependent dehydrogenase (short-subunit alcohol dehydrogenase family)|uniref:SDR family oxidoreductase n=1 Tax=Aureimonas sp. Leaf324 TaxID=1736336 RepID=UPI0006FC1887|nr:SDR family oxidoreductase [Aureimonas sp. Leaf324]KQQ90309.1 NAD(P)-dependent oxidoreductase [Aureimonas sp. Leaf324]